MNKDKINGDFYHVKFNIKPVYTTDFDELYRPNVHS